MSKSMTVTSSPGAVNEKFMLTRQKLEQLLREAEKAHAEYEAKLGHRDNDWPVWYAEFIVKKLGVDKRKGYN